MLGNIQFLRWLAATLVVLFHAALKVAQEGGALTLTSSFRHWGESGVDAFFVISGLVMILSQTRHPRGVMAFLAERALRILPLYWSLSLAMGAILAVAPQLFKIDVFSAGRLVSSLAMVSRAMGYLNPTIFVGWTLEYEVLFYLVFALSCRFVALHWTWAVVGGLFGLGALLGLTPLFMLEFALGMAVGTAWSWAKAPRRTGLGLALILGGLLGGFVLFHLQGAGADHFRAWGLPATALVAGLVLLPQLSGAWVLRAGAASYAVYLIQVPVLPLAFRGIDRFLPGMTGDLRVICATLVTLLAGLLCHLWFEAPITRALKRRLRGASPVDLGPAAR